MPFEPPSERELRAMVARGLFDQLLLEEVGKKRARELLVEAGEIAASHSGKAVRKLVVYSIRRASDPRRMNEPVNFRDMLKRFEDEEEDDM